MAPIEPDYVDPTEWRVRARSAEAEVERLRSHLAVVAADLRKADAELRKVEPVLVAADRLREAYEAMIEGRDIGGLGDWSHE